MKPKRILVCDDDPDITHVTRLILELEGYGVGTVEYLQSEVDFMRVVQQEQPDLVLMDLRIPQIGGIKATKILKSNAITSNIPVVLFSANHTVVEISRKIGADGVIRKPFDIEDITSVVQQLI